MGGRAGRARLALVAGARRTRAATRSARWFESVREPGCRSRTVFDGVLVGSTSSYLNVREHDRVLEIGNTWLAPQAWGTGANAEAKLLLMEHAFEDEGFLRVEFKTDAKNERARAALAALPPSSRASSASTCSCAAASGATRRGTA